MCARRYKKKRLNANLSRLIDYTRRDSNPRPSFRKSIFQTILYIRISYSGKNLYSLTSSFNCFIHRMFYTELNRIPYILYQKYLDENYCSLQINVSKRHLLTPNNMSYSIGNTTDPLAWSHSLQYSRDSHLVYHSTVNFISIWIYLLLFLSLEIQYMHLQYLHLQYLHLQTLCVYTIRNKWGRLKLFTHSNYIFSLMKPIHY